MAFFQLAPAPALGRNAMKRLVSQLSRASASPLSSSSITQPTTAAASRIASRFVCRRCIHTSKAYKASPPLQPSSARSQKVQQLRDPFAPFARCLSNSSAKKTTAATPSLDSKFDPNAGSSAHEDAGADSKSKSKAKSWPETTSKSVAIWLLGSAASVFGIVVFGGLTRLTESG